MWLYFKVEISGGQSDYKLKIQRFYVFHNLICWTKFLLADCLRILKDWTMPVESERRFFTDKCTISVKWIRNWFWIQETLIHESISGGDFRECEMIQTKSNGTEKCQWAFVYLYSIYMRLNCMNCTRCLSSRTIRVLDALFQSVYIV